MKTAEKTEVFMTLKMMEKTDFKDDMFTRLEKTRTFQNNGLLKKLTKKKKKKDL